MSFIPSISDALRVMTARTEADIIADSSLDWGTLPKKVHFMHGNPKEIISVLLALTKGSATKNEKYPLVGLFRDFRETIEEIGLNRYSTSCRPRLIIATLTNPSFRAEDRKLKNFDPILHPILERLIFNIRMSGEFGMPTVKQLNPVIWDRYFWGSDLSENSFNEYVDAVEIEGLDLKLLDRIC